LAFIRPYKILAVLLSPVTSGGMFMDSIRIKEFKPGRVLDGHVHDLLGVPEPVWPYSTHEKAQVRLREWLAAQKVEIRLPRWRRPNEDTFIHVGDLSDRFSSVSTNHALCLAVLLADYLKKHGRKIKYGRF
jgi:hypothetical protein